MGSIIWAVVLAAGIPSAVIGFLIARLHKKLDHQEKKKEEKENANHQNLIHLIELTAATLALSKATAEAVARIPDANCNGDMHEALEFALEMREKYRKFQREQMIKAIH